MKLMRGSARILHFVNDHVPVVLVIGIGQEAGRLRDRLVEIAA